MKHLTNRFSALLLLLSVLCFYTQNDFARVPRKPRKSIVILYENDVHCAIDGYAKMAGLRDAIRDTSWCELVSSGDFLQGGTPGALSRGQYIADIMKNMDYAAITLGNHEFDYGYPRMTQLISEIDAPTTCVNLRDLSNGKMVYQPYVIRQIGDKSIAFIGVLTPTTLLTEEIGFFDKNGLQTHDLCPADIYVRVQKAVDEVRAQGVDYVVVLSHLGEDDNSLHVDSHHMIAATTGIDVVLDGHTHSVVPQLTVNNKEGKPVLITQTGTQFQNVGKLLITKEGKLSTGLISIKSIETSNERVQAVTDSVKAIYHEKVSQKVGSCKFSLTINDDNGNRLIRRSETNLGDLVADAFLSRTDADICITNGGGIRTSLPVGDITYGDVITVLPFENYLMVAELTGQQISEVLQACCSSYPAESGDFPQVAGLKFTLNVNEKGSEPTVSDILILDKKTKLYTPVDPQRNYTIGTINYCITGGGLKGLLKNCKITRQNLDLYCEALTNYIVDTLHGNIGDEYTQSQNRISIVEK